MSNKTQEIISYVLTYPQVYSYTLPENPKNLIHLIELQNYIDKLNFLNRKINIEI